MARRKFFTLPDGTWVLNDPLPTSALIFGPYGPIGLVTKVKPSFNAAKLTAYKAMLAVDGWPQASIDAHTSFISNGSLPLRYHYNGDFFSAGTSKVDTTDRSDFMDDLAAVVTASLGGNARDAINCTPFVQFLKRHVPLVNIGAVGGIGPGVLKLTLSNGQLTRAAALGLVTSRTDSEEFYFDVRGTPFVEVASVSYGENSSGQWRSMGVSFWHGVTWSASAYQQALHAVGAWAPGTLTRAASRPEFAAEYMPVTPAPPPGLVLADTETGFSAANITTQDMRDPFLVVGYFTPMSAGVTRAAFRLKPMVSLSGMIPFSSLQSVGYDVSTAKIVTVLQGLNSPSQVILDTIGALQSGPPSIRTVYGQFGERQHDLSKTKLYTMAQDAGEDLREKDFDQRPDKEYRTRKFKDLEGLARQSRLDLGVNIQSVTFPNAVISTRSALSPITVTVSRDPGSSTGLVFAIQSPFLDEDVQQLIESAPDMLTFAYATTGTGLTVAERLELIEPAAGWRWAYDRAVSAMCTIYFGVAFQDVSSIASSNGERAEVAPWTPNAYVGSYPMDKFVPGYYELGLMLEGVKWRDLQKLTIGVGEAWADFYGEITGTA